MRLLRYADLQELGIRYSRGHMNKLSLAGSFPVPVQLSTSRIAWVAEEVEEWLASRARTQTSNAKAAQAKPQWVRAPRRPRTLPKPVRTQRKQMVGV
jgi:predicted DNA-binding transcriptional regulator AlpA